MAAREDNELRNARTTQKEKENRPPSPVRPRQSLIPSLVKSPERLEFFTDSYLGNSDVSLSSAPSSTSSRLPTLKTKQSQKRSKKSADDGLNGSKHRSAQSESYIPRPKEIRVIHKRQTTGINPVRSLGLSTPPRSREGDPVVSPLSTFSSPPRALTDTYERISQEEDLAATEGEISDPESPPPHTDQAIVLQSRLDTSNDQPPHASSLLTQSRATTPTQQIREDHRQAPYKDDELTTASIRSDPTGTSFWQNLSDRGLAEAMTPMAIQRAEDRQAFRHVWAQKKAQAFGRAGSVNMGTRGLDDPALAPSIPSQRLRAFSKAHRIKLDSDYLIRPSHQRTFSDVAQQVTRSQDDQAVPIARSDWHNEETTRGIMPHNPRLHKPPHFARVHGFPERNSVPQHDDGGTAARAPCESPGMYSADPGASPASRRQGRDLSRGNVESYGGNAFESDQVHAARQEDFIRSDYRPPLEQRLREETPQRSRRFDVDFTGQSFQVSDSPSVQVKSSPHEYIKRREIEVVAKQAVATSRLSQLRARESLENLRRLSVSSAEEPGDGNESMQADHPNINNEQTPNGSAGRYHSALSDVRQNSPAAKANSSSGYSNSHELLQRLAKGSAAPRSSSSSSSSKREGRDINTLTQRGELDRTSSTSPGGVSSKHHLSDHQAMVKDHANNPAIQETPRPAGAWTDTILPDTVKTSSKKSSLLPAQTPHVSAGGWVDTPAAKSQIWGLEPVPEATMEVPGDLVAGIARERVASVPSLTNNENKADAIDGVPGARDAVNDHDEEVVPVEARSIAQKVLKDLQEKSTSLGEPNALQSAIDDTLQLNPSTLQSIQNVLDTNTEDFTSLSRLGADLDSPNLDDTVNTVTSLSDTQLLSRLSAKIDKVMTTMQDARRGITHLVEQVASSESVELADKQQNITKAEHKQPTQPTPQPTITHTDIGSAIVTAPGTASSAALHTVFPVGLAVFSLPIPLLWRSARSDLGQRFARPTALGWILIGLWSWYILETVLSELYSHPLYASSYSWPDQREPEFPFVLPTVLWRWSRFGILYRHTVQPFVDLLTAVFKMLAMMVGLTDGFVDQAPSKLHQLVSETVSTVVSGATSMAPDVNMNLMNDEFV